MCILLDYKDSFKLVKPRLSDDGYETEVIDEIYDVNGLFISATGFQRGNNQTAVTSDAQVYIDPTNEVVLANYDRLEEWYIIASPFGGSDHQSWYKIEQVIIGQDKLLENEIDNINLQLKKTSEIPSVS